ncbi:pimeloyl-ACP methyl ester carboxylesterase [Pseudonocardia sediminis]|uniref:Pimeloyl-ACP methyl ester carboxylesterase n=1 Tax=Pseudonocardia sediminis TaxID=1397368 RepID=A0A4Q7V1E3_PSEST|nr:alpha/beta hydrolase [Pseudonocardia sediminis]RZT88332.1 pimeloyl-ACP methyl ester carboxylesterase [Pseudonocardia sediminis]
MVSRKAWQAAGVAGGVASAAGAAVGLGVAAHRRQIATARRALATDMAEHGGVPPIGLGEECSVTADDGVRIACEEIETPDGEKPALTVVLVHGFALDRRTWQEQRAFLAGLAEPRIRFVLYDQRSHGRSERAPQASCTIEQLGHDLDAVIRALAPEGPLVLVSHSMGGMTVMALAEQNPDLFHERVAGVALISTSAGDMASGLPGTFLSRRNPLTRGLGMLAAWQPGLVETGRRALGDVIWAITKRFAYGDRHVDPRMVDLVDTMIDSNAVGALTDFVDTLGTHDRVAALPGLSGCEVLVLAGDADRIIPYRHSEVIAAALPTARLVRLTGVGHMPMLEQSERVDDELADLIERSLERSRSGRFRLRRPRRSTEPPAGADAPTKGRGGARGRRSKKRA